MGPCSGFNGFIAFEGIDGSGKTTQMHRLAWWLRHRRDVRAVVTKEPTNGVIGQYIDSPGRSKTRTPLQDVLLFYADRQEHLDNVILPALAQKEIVLCDRFSDSTRSYQGLSDDVPDSLLRELEDSVVGPNKPLVVLLDLDAELAVERLKKSGHEVDDSKLEFYKKVRASYLALAQGEPTMRAAVTWGGAKRYIVIDASKDEDTVFDRILGGLSEYFRQLEIIVSPSTYMEQRRYKKYYD